MTDMTPPPVPVEQFTSLDRGSAVQKTVIEGWVGDKNSPYWKGNDVNTAAGIQTHYRDLIRGEIAGERNAVGPSHATDADLPQSVKQYDLAGAHGAASMTAIDRDIIDRFLPVAYAAGLGQRKVEQLVGWCLTIPGITMKQFKTLAHDAGWSDRATNVCARWYYEEKARRAGHAPTESSATRAQRSRLLARKAEIEASMYVNGKPNPQYFRGPLSAEYAKILKQIA